MNEESRINSIWRGERVELRAKTLEDIARYVADGVADDMGLYGNVRWCSPKVVTTTLCCLA